MGSLDLVVRQPLQAEGRRAHRDGGAGVTELHERGNVQQLVAGLWEENEADQDVLGGDPGEARQDKRSALVRADFHVAFLRAFAFHPHLVVLMETAANL
eukprot:scaffold1951_cov258-Pinguiococcus_pyrenoidosus.AAC.11